MDRTQLAAGGLLTGPARYTFGNDQGGCFIPRRRSREDPDTRAAVLAQAASWYGISVAELTNLNRRIVATTSSPEPTPAAQAEETFRPWTPPHIPRVDVAAACRLLGLPDGLTSDIRLTPDAVIVTIASRISANGGMQTGDDHKVIEEIRTIPVR